MPKDCVYQLRLTSEEKAKLASVAKDRDSSIAQMIRKDYGLDGEVRAVIPVHTGGREKPGPVPPERVSEMFDEKRFKQMVAQLMGSRNLPKDQAEELARQRMGS